MKKFRPISDWIQIQYYNAEPYFVFQAVTYYLKDFIRIKDEYSLQTCPLYPEYIHGIHSVFGTFPGGLYISIKGSEFVKLYTTEI